MAVFKVQAPDGTIIKVEAADEATAIRGAQEHYASTQAPKAPVKTAAPPKAAAPIFDPVGDVGRAVGPAVDNLKSTYDQFSKTGKGDALGAMAGVPLALLQGLTTNQITGPASRALAATDLPIYDGNKYGAPVPLQGDARQQAFEGDIGTALSAIKPGPGKIAPITRVAPSGMAPVDAAATRYVAKVAKAAGPQALATAPKGVTAAEALGNNGKAAVGALARRQGATGDALQATIADRQMTRPTRMLEDFAAQAGIAPEAAAGDLQAVVDAGRAKAAPLYEAAYADPAPQSDKLDALLTRPSMKGAMNRAVRIAAEEGRDPTSLGFDLDGEGNVVNIRSPSMQTMDYVKRGLDDVLNARRDTVTGKLHLDEEGRAVLRTLNDFRGEVAKPGSNYRAALDASGDYLSADNAFKDGSKFVFNQNVNEGQFADRLGKMSDADREAFTGGIANKFFDLAQTGKLDPKVLKTPRVRAKLTMALGPEKAQRLIQLASHEGDMLSFERRYGPGAGSITQEMKDAMDAQDAGNVGGKMASDFVGGLHQGPIKAAGGAISKQLQATLDAIGPTRGMSVPVRDAAGEQLLLPPEDLAKLLADFAKNPPKRGGLKLDPRALGPLLQIPPARQADSSRR